MVVVVVVVVVAFVELEVVSSIRRDEPMTVFSVLILSAALRENTYTHKYTHTCTHTADNSRFRS